MKEGWKYESFCNVFPIRMGKTPPRADKEMWDANKKTKNLWVSVADITSNEGQDIISTKEHISELAAQRMHIVPKGYLLMSFKLTIGKMAFAGKDLFTNEAIIAIPKNDKYNLRFLYYYLSSYNWDTLTTGAEKVKGKTLNKSSIGKIQLPIIPLPEQERIVSLLDAEFAKIDAIKANAEKQLQDAKALFRSALKDYLTPKEGWKEKTLKEITSKIGSGATPKGGRKVYIKEGCSLIRSMNVHYGFFKYDDLAHINDEAARQLNGVEIYEDDVLFNITGASIARCCVVPNDILPARVNQHVSILRTKPEMVLPVFLSYLLISPTHQKELLQIGEAGSTRQALTKTNLEEHIVTIPLIEEQYRIMEKIEQLSAKIHALQSNFDTTVTLCNDLKQSILKDIFG